MQFEHQLKLVGLSQSEVRVYLYLLEQGLSTPSQIAKSAGMTRTNSYHVLRSLKDKEFIEEQQRRKRKAYFASDPVSLIRSLDKKKGALEGVLPDLRALFTVQKNKPKIKFYDGWDEVKDIYVQTLNAKEIFAIGSITHFHNRDPLFFKQYQKKLWKRKIFFKAILGNISQQEVAETIKPTVRGYYDVRFLPLTKGDPTTDIFIWNDNVGIIAFDEPIFGTVLTNPLLAQTFRIVFSTLWDSL